MIVGTAGHIDHGKTSLVKALTGVDTDRLHEEKARGISIELGWAYLHDDAHADAADADGATLGFVDVPGHERLLHTMLAGASGIDHELLLVAADDGVMPQTREHLAVLSLLGIDQGSLAITKIDRVDAARLQEVRTEIDALLQGSALAAAPRFAVSSVDSAAGDGIDALRRHLWAAARAFAQRARPQRDAHAAFRLAVDRAFSLPGVGTVVAGRVQSGQVRPGDELALLHDGESRSVRVRSLHANNRAADLARAGDRCALALPGLELAQVRRGDWLCTPAIALTATRIDVALTLWHDEAKPLRGGTTVHLHLGTADVMASVAPLDGDAIAPGQTALAQLVLREPIGAWHGERGVLRDASASRTIGGLRVLDPFAPSRLRRTPQRLATLAASALREPQARLAALLAASPLGLERGPLARALAWLPARLDAALAQIEGARLLDDAQAPAVIAQPHLQALQQRILDALAAFHAAQSDSVGPDARRLQRIVAPRAPQALWRAALQALQDDGSVLRNGAWLQLRAHAQALGEAQQASAQRIAPWLVPGEPMNFDPPWVRDIARDANLPEAQVRSTLAALARRGELHAVVKDLYYPAPTIERLAQIAREAGAATPGGLTAAAFRDATGLGRKRAIQLLEYFDRVGLLRRAGDAHVLRDAELHFADPSSGGDA